MSELAVIDRPLSVAEIKSNIGAIHRALTECMIKDTHYGIIPGCGKPSLWKPGAELIAAMFGISAQYETEDLSTQDCVRYRVRCRGISRGGIVLGEGMGECSSDEEKFRWRAAVCDAEFNETPEDRRRSKWKQGKSNPYQVHQVRTETADQANTVLKMAVKRSNIGMVRAVTACSDVFEQDVEDLPEGMIDAQPAPEPIKPPREKAPTPQPQTTGGDRPTPSGNVITEKQRGRFYGKCRSAGLTDDEAKAKIAEYGFNHSSEITRDVYDELCAWADGTSEGT